MAHAALEVLSVVFDPVGYVVGEVGGALMAMAMGQPVNPGGPVLIGGRMSTVTGDSASMPIKHLLIPPGTTFVTGITPSDAELLVGSADRSHRAHARVAVRPRPCRDPRGRFERADDAR